jgi:hypothetical protein
MTRKTPASHANGHPLTTALTFLRIRVSTIAVKLIAAAIIKAGW